MYSGLRFLLRCPGVSMEKIPRTMIPLEYEMHERMQDSSKVWSSDKQLLFVDATLFIRFPYNNGRALVKLLQSGVPLADEKLTEWAEDAIVPALRQVLSKMKYEDAISAVNLEFINDEVNKILRKADGLFDRVGLFGDDPHDATPGSGEAFLEVEQVLVSEELRKKLERLETANIDAKAAKYVADMNAETIGGQILGTVARLHNMSVRELKKDLKTHPEKRGKLVKDGGYVDSFKWAQAQTTRDRAKSFVLTEKQSKDELNVHTAGRPVRDIGGLAAAAKIVGDAIANARGQNPPTSPPATP